MIDHASRSHAVFGASSAHRWFACPGSVRLCEGLPDRPSAAALEGTRAHELLEALLLNAEVYRQRQYGEKRNAAAARSTKLWHEAPQDMRDAVHVCVDYVKEILEDHPDAVLLVEHRFEIPVAAAPGEVFGTNDVCIFVPSMRLLYVIDYKHGAGTFVDVRGNKQLRFYALGALASVPQNWTGRKCSNCDGTGEKYNEVYDCERACGLCAGTGEEYGKMWHIDTVALVIVQPRCPIGDAVREDWLPIEEVLRFGPVIGEAVTRCKAPDALLVPGEDQCRFCRAATVCPAREAQALDAAGSDFGDVANVAHAPGGLQEPRTITGDRLGDLLRAKSVIVGWFDDLENEARRRLEAGEAVKDHKLVEAQARRQWNSDDVFNVADALSELTSGHGAKIVRSQEFKIEKLQTLTEVERILKQGCDRKEARRRLDAMAYLTTKKSSGALKVVPQDDPRPAVDRGAAFDGVVAIPHVKETE